MACQCRKITTFVGLAVVVAFIAIALQQPSLEQFPDVGKTTHQIITSRGFEHEVHFIHTSDGYILQTTRIINPTVKDRSKLKPVLLQHGFQCQSSHWLIAADGKLQSNGRYVEPVTANDAKAVGNSLGFVLASQGYDVWLSDYRGNIHSRNHTTLSPESDEFWKFSIDDMIVNDLPAQIEYIKKATKKKTISYIGHSQGNYMMLALLSLRPEYSNTIKPFIALSPVSFFTKFEAPLVYFKYFKRQLLWAFPRDYGTNLFNQLRLTQLCANRLLQKNVCYYVYWFFFGTPRAQVDYERLPVYVNHFMAGSSTRNYVQLLQQESIPTKYSYDDEEPGRNLREYKADFPSIYKLGNINSTDIALVYTKRDWYNHIADVHLLKESLNVKLLDDYQVPDQTWNHMELLWGKDVGKLVNERVLKLLAKY